MHELSVMNSIIQGVHSHAKKHRATIVREVTLSVGDFAFLSPDQLRFAFDIYRKSSPDSLMNDAKLVLLSRPGNIRCGCGYDGEIELSNTREFHQMYPILLCPECGEPPLEVTGKECLITNIKMEVP